MIKEVQDAIDVLRSLPEEKAEIAVAAIINIAAADEDDVERDA